MPSIGTGTSTRPTAGRRRVTISRCNYEPGGLLIGTAKLGEAAGNQTGWMDNTAALAVARDPRDGILDVFGEDSWLNRIIWYRVDDRKVAYVTGTIEVK